MGKRQIDAGQRKAGENFTMATGSARKISWVSG